MTVSGPRVTISSFTILAGLIVAMSRPTVLYLLVASVYSAECGAVLSDAARPGRGRCQCAAAT